MDVLTCRLIYSSVRSLVNQIWLPKLSFLSHSNQSPANAQMDTVKRLVLIQGLQLVTQHRRFCSATIVFLFCHNIIIRHFLTCQDLMFPQLNRENVLQLGSKAQDSNEINFCHQDNIKCRYEFFLEFVFCRCEVRHHVTTAYPNYTQTFLIRQVADDIKVTLPREQCYRLRCVCVTVYPFYWGN